MLLPALDKAHNTAQGINCLSNLKQQGVMLLMYSAGSNDLTDQNNSAKCDLFLLGRENTTFVSVFMV